MSSLKCKDIMIYVNETETLCKPNGSLFVGHLIDKSIAKTYLRQLEYKEKLEGLSNDEKHDKQECINELKIR